MDLNHLNLRVRDPAECRDFYQRHLCFRPAFEAEDGYFLENDDGFLLALVPPSPVGHRPLPEGVHLGFRLGEPDAVADLHQRLGGEGVRIGEIDDYRPEERHVTFRCWDPDGTEIEIFWDGEFPRTASDVGEDRYEAVLDRLVKSCREGQGQIGPVRARRGLWNANATPEALADQYRFNTLLQRMAAGDREVLAAMLEERFVAGVHETLVVLHEGGIEPFDSGAEGTPFHDFIGRLQDWQPGTDGAGG